MDIRKDIRPMTAFDLAAEASEAEGIRQGLEDLRSGRSRLAREVFEELRAEHAIPR